MSVKNFLSKFEYMIELNRNAESKIYLNDLVRAGVSKKQTSLRIGSRAPAEDPGIRNCTTSCIKAKRTVSTSTISLDDDEDDEYYVQELLMGVISQQSKESFTSTKNECKSTSDDGCCSIEIPISQQIRTPQDTVTSTNEKNETMLMDESKIIQSQPISSVKGNSNKKSILVVQAKGYTTTGSQQDDLSRIVKPVQQVQWNDNVQVTIVPAVDSSRLNSIVITHATSSTGQNGWNNGPFHGRSNRINCLPRELDFSESDDENDAF